MATDDRKVQLGVTVDATGARQGFSDVKDSARDMAQSVVTQGNTASKAIDSIGNGGAASAQKVDAATRSMIQSIQRTTAAMEAGSKTSSQYYEALAQQRGIPSDALAPYLAQLDAATAKQGAASESLDHFSASSTRARTELVVLAHELLQGNWTRMTGSVMVMAEATDALGAIMSPLGLAIGATVGALALFATAAVKGYEESDKLNKALQSTGQYAGATAGQIDDMAARIGASSGHVTMAEQALMELVASGKVSGSALESVGTAAVAMSEATGESVDKVVKQFISMSDDVAKGAAKMNDQYHFLTLAQYDEIEALQKHDDKMGAMKIAADALTTSIENQKVPLGTLPSILHTAALAWDEFWRAAMNAGKPDTPASKVDALKTQIEQRTAELQNPLVNLVPGVKSAMQGVLADLKGELQAAEQDAALHADSAGIQSMFDQIQGNGITASQKLTEMQKNLRTRQQIRDDEIADIKKYYADARAAAAANPDQVDPASYSQQSEDALIAATNAKYAPKKTGQAGLIDKTQLQGEVQAIKDALAEELAAVSNSQKQLDVLYKGGGISESAYYQQTRDNIAQAATDKINAANQDAAILTKGLNDQKLSAAQKAQINNQIQQDQAAASKATEDFFNAIADSAAKEDEVWAKYGADQLAAMQKQADAANQQDQSLKDQIDTFGLGKGAIDAMKASRADDTVAALEQGRAIAILQNDMADTKPWDDSIAKAKELSAALHGMASDQATLDQMNEAKKVADQTVQDWKSAANSIENGITNALMNGFNNGKSFGQQLADSLKAMFKTLVLQPIIAPIAGSMAGIMYPGAQQAYAQTNPNSPLSSLFGNPTGSMNTLSRGYNTVSNWLGGGYGSASTAFGSSAIGGATDAALSAGYLGADGAAMGASTLGGLGGSIAGDVVGSSGGIASGLGVGASGASVFSAAGGSGLGLAGTLGSSAGMWLGGAGLLGGLAGGALFGNKGYSSLGGSLGAMGGMALGASTAVAGTAIGAELGAFAGPIGAIAGMALGAALGSLIGGGETRYGADYTIDGADNISKVRGPSGGDPASDQVQASIKSTFDSITSLAQQMGGSVSGLGPYSATYEVSPQKGDSFVSAGFGDLSGYAGRQDLGGVKDSTTVLNDFSLQLQRSVISGLQQANLDSPYASVLQGVDASKLSATDITNLLNELNSLKSLFDSIKAMGSDFDNLKNASTTAQLAVINLAGGVSTFNTNATYFEQNFVPAAEQTANQAKSVTDQLAALGMSSVKTNDQFREAVEGIDLTTTAGQQLYVQMLALAPAFNTMTQAEKQAADAQQSLWNQYFSAIYTPAQQVAMSTKQLQDQFSALGVAMPKSNADFEALVENMDTSTQPMKDLQNELLALAPAFGQLTQAATQSVSTALGNVQTAYNNQIQAINANITSISNFITQLTNLKQSLSLGSLSTLSPQDRYLAEKQLFESTSASAAAGDATAQGNLPQVAQDFLTASQAYNASSQAYVNDYNEVQATLDKNIASAQQQLSVAQQQLDATNQMVQGILDLNTTAQSLSDALQAYFAAGGTTSAAAGAAAAGTYGGSAGGNLNLAQVQATAVNGLIPYSDANPYGPMGGYTVADWQVANAAGPSAAFLAANPWIAQLNAINGSHAGGADYIPFDGYRAELHKGEAVVTSANNQKLSQMLNIDWSQYGRPNSDATAALIKAMSDKIERLESAVRTVGAAQLQLSQQQHAESQATRTKQARQLQTVGDNTGRIAAKK